MVLLIPKIIRFQKIFSEGQKFFGKWSGLGVFRENFEKFRVLFLISFAQAVRIFQKKDGVGVFWENFDKYHGTFLFFHLLRGWVVNLKNYEKSAYNVPSKKYLHPHPQTIRIVLNSTHSRIGSQGSFRRCTFLHCFLFRSKIVAHALICQFYVGLS